MPTVAQMITRILRPMRDADQVFFPDAELIEYLNEAVVNLASRQLLFHAEDSTCLTTSGSIPFANIGGDSDVLRLRWVVDTEGREVSWLDPSTFKTYQLAYPEWSEETPLAAIWEETVWLWPAPPDGETWSVGYYGLPPAITSDAETFPLSRVWEEKAVRFARAQCYYRLGEKGFGDEDMRSFEEGLRPNDRVFDRNLPGTLTLSREGNVFDTDTESIHQG